MESVFDSAIPAPEAILGSGPHPRPARHYEILDYCEKLAAAAPDRVALTEYGSSHEGRRLIYLTISAPTNMNRRNEIEARLRRIGDGENQDLTDIPAACWIGHGIHGDELSGGDAALEVAYRLVAGRGEEAERLRQNLIVHIDPAANPDGRERCLAMRTSFSSAVEHLDPVDLAHTGLWPGGRGNHYLFDLNRDGAALVQPESRARAAALWRLSPQLVIDVHEMEASDSYLFSPPAPPINPHVPDHVHCRWDEFAADHAAAFDAHSISYYTGEWNEVFYPGYADILPAYHGAVPILYEQSATGGGSVRQPSGRIVRYADAIENHCLSAFANLHTAARMHGALVEGWAAGRRAAIAGGLKHAYLIEGDGWATAWLLDRIEAHGITVEQHRTNLECFRVPLGQPLAPLIHNLLADDIALPSEFLDSERRALARGGCSKLYDVTAWSLALAANLRVQLVDKEDGTEWDKRAMPARSALPVVVPQYGYIISDPIGHAAAALMRQGVSIRVATQSFRIGGVDYPAGTLLVRREENRELAVECLSSLLNFSSVYPAESARTEAGPYLGGRTFVLLRLPRIGVLSGAAVDSCCYGGLWHLLDREIAIEFTALTLERLDAPHLSEFNVLLLPAVANGNVLIDRLPALRAWVENGGTLVAIASAARAVGTLFDDIDIESPSPYDPSGAYLKAQIDEEHWLGFSASAVLPVLAHSGEVLNVGGNAKPIVRFAGTDGLKIGGLLWPEAAERIAGSAYLVQQHGGLGQVILFAHDPAFRGYSVGTARLLTNALLFGPGMRDQ